MLFTMASRDNPLLYFSIKNSQLFTFESLDIFIYLNVPFNEILYVVGEVKYPKQSVPVGHSSA